MFTTLQTAIAWARPRLPDADVALLEAQLLLADVLGQARSYVIAHPEATLSEAQIARYQKLVQARAQGVPYAYLVGKRAFYDLEFAVTPDVLIPRPETELLVEEAIAFARTRPALVVADIGTGSGAIAVTLAHHAPHAHVYATDVSPAALAIAQRNAAQTPHGARINFLCGNLAQPLIDTRVKVDLLLANLPYIPTDEWRTLEVSQHEPRIALDGGTDGLTLIRELMAQIPQVCREGALVLLEHGTGQSTALQAHAQATLRPRAMRVIYDYARHDRILRLEV